MTLSVLIVGCGYFARFHREAWQRIAGVRVAGLCDLDDSKLADAAADTPGAGLYTDIDTALRDLKPDIVDIATGPATHLDLVRKVAQTKAFISCQKPLADTYSEAVEVVEAAEQHGARLAVHENFRFMPWFIESKKVLDTGLLGKPLAISFRLRTGDGQGSDAYLARQPYFQKMPRFLVHETAIHLIDVFRHLMGEISGVFARLKRFNAVIAGEDAGYIVFDFTSGAQGLFDGNRHLDHPADNTRLTTGVMLLEGTEGSLRLDGYGTLFFKPRSGIEREHAYTWNNNGFGGDCVYNQIRHFAEHLIEGVPLQNSGRDYLRNLEIEEAVYRSNTEERFIKV
ncbi:MAG: Gfo/Idh/MocA family protein [Beijerinckiaceae bacterium]